MRQSPPLSLDIDTKLTFVCIVFLASIVIGAAVLVSLVEQRAKTGLEASLTAVLQTSNTGLEVWAREQQLILKSFTESKMVKNTTEALLSTTADAKSLSESEAQTNLREIFFQHLSSGQYRGFFIIGPDNINLASSRDKNLGMRNLLSEQPDILDKLWAGEFTISRIQASDVPLVEYSLPERHYSLFAGMPIHNSVGDVIAILTLRIDPNETLFPILFGGTLGKTGETYAFDGKGEMLSRTRYEKDLSRLKLLNPEEEMAAEDKIPLHFQIADPGVNLYTDLRESIPIENRALTLMAQSAIKGESGVNLEGYRDFRGVPVVGAWLWNDFFNIGIATEQEVTEAYALYFFTRQVIYIATALTLILTLILFNFWHRARQQMKEAGSRVNAVVDTAIDAIVIIDSDGTIETVNPATEQMFGYSASQLINNNISMLMPHSYAVEHLNYLRRFDKTQESQVLGVNRELVAKRVDGSVFPIELSVNCLELNNGMHFAGVIRDISKAKASEQQLQDLIAELRVMSLVSQTTNESVIISNPEGLISWTNNGFTLMTGYSQDEVLGQKPGDFLQGPDTDPKTISLISKRIKKHERIKTEILNYNKSGKPYWIQIEITPVFDEQGGLVQFVSLQRDITTQRNMVKELQLARNEAESERDALHEANQIMALTSAALDRTGISEFWISADSGLIARGSQQACKMLGCELEQLLKLHLWDFDLEMTEDRFYKWKASVEAQGWSRFETTYQSCNGNRKPMEIITMYKPADSKGQSIIIAFAIDISKRKETEIELIQARESAEKADRTKSTFLATMSHEIRTPLTGIIGTIDMLQHTQLLSNQQDLLRTAKASAQQLQGVIDDVLDFSKIEAGSLQLESIPLSLESLVETVGSNLRYISNQFDIELLIFSDPNLPEVKGDPVRLKQILFNLAGNAVKFSRHLEGRSGQVQVSVHLRELRHQQVSLMIQVKDNGIGMKDEVCKNLFQPFMQADPEITRLFGGTGLGLVITQRLVKMMGGHIEVESQHDQGSTFSVFLTLPVYENHEDAESNSLEGVQVLLINDLAEATHIIESYLKHAGALITTATADKALQAYQSFADPKEECVVLIDNHGSQHNSSTIYEQLTHANDYPNLPIVVVERGRRGYARINHQGFMALDLNVMRRQTLLNAVAASIGRESPEQHLNNASDSELVSTLVGVDSRDKCSVLLVDDNATNRNVIGHQLQMLRCEVDYAVDGMQAVTKWRCGNYDLLLTDCHMPYMDGYQLARCIRDEEGEGSHHIPIIAITADAMKGTESRCFDAGMDGYLTKPLQLIELNEMLHKWFDKRADKPSHMVSSFKTEVDSNNNRNETFEATAAVDKGSLAELTGSNDPAILSEFYQDFLDSNRATAQQIQAAHAVQDLSNLGKEAHKMKSAALTIGATPLAEICHTLELSCKTEDSETIEREMQRFPSCYTQVETWIMHYINNN